MTPSTACRIHGASLFALLSFLICSSTSAIQFTVEFRATVYHNSFTAEMDAAAGLPEDSGMHTLDVGSPISVILSFDSDPHMFIGSGLTSDVGEPWKSFVVYNSSNEILGSELAIYSELIRAGTLLEGSLLSGPALFEADFTLDTLNRTGVVKIIGAGSEDYPYAGGFLGGFIQTFRITPDPSNVPDSGIPPFSLGALLALLAVAQWRMKCRAASH